MFILDLPPVPAIPPVQEIAIVECVAIDNQNFGEDMHYCETEYGIHYDEIGPEDGIVYSDGSIQCPIGWELSFDYDPKNDLKWSACM